MSASTYDDATLKSMAQNLVRDHVPHEHRKSLWFWGIRVGNFGAALFGKAWCSKCACEVGEASEAL